MKYKVGDKVRVRPDLQIKDYGDYYCAVEEMSLFKGDYVTISEVNNVGYYIEEDEGQFLWTDDMLSFTNADRIRYMTDDDLVSWFYQVSSDILKGKIWNNGKWLKWLKEECK